MSARRPGRRAARGMTLVEMMVAHGLALAVLAGGVTAGLALQRRSRLDEQAVAMQASAQAVRQALEADLQRAGAGLGSATLVLSSGVQGQALQVMGGALFEGDSTFAAPPTGPYAGLTSDALQLWWAQPDGMLVLRPCGAAPLNHVRDAATGAFCTAAFPSRTLEGSAVLVLNPASGLACHGRLDGVDTSGERARLSLGHGGQPTTAGPCASLTDSMWRLDGWSIAATGGTAYRVNWKGGSPQLEQRAPGATAWRPVARSVERLLVRQAVVDTARPFEPLRWFPDAAAGRPALDACTRTNPLCAMPDLTPAPADDAALVTALRQRVREVEVVLVVRSARPDASAARPGSPLDPATGFPRDGYRRRVLTFRPGVRNLALAGVVP